MVSPLYNACLTFSRRFSMSEIKHRAATLTTGVASLTLAMAPLLLLFWLMQPKVLANPGIGALRVAQAASWEPFLQESPLRESPRSSHQKSPASLAQDGPQYRQPKTSAKRELRASDRKRFRLAQKRKTMASRLPARRHQTRPASFAATSSTHRGQGRLATAAGGKDWLTP
ncbi:MAG: hypothetical protein V7640_767 [Betaproteobacteria bacterium]|jgi:hypothetical protein